MQEIQVRFLGQEDPLEKEMATYSSILPGESHGQRSLAGYSPWAHNVVATRSRNKLTQKDIADIGVHRQDQGRVSS